MKKTALKRLLLIALIILLSVSSILIYRSITQATIQHYKQYIFPCEGRIASYQGTDTLVQFCVLDEVEISEMAEEGNIRAIRFVAEDDEKIDAKDWQVTDGSNIYTNRKYSTKFLDVTILNEKNITLHSMEIVYPDSVETFDIGQLSIFSQTITNAEARTQISSMVTDKDPYQGLINDTVEKILYQATVLEFSAYSLGMDYSINRIDLGIPGMGIDPSTLQEMQEDVNELREPYANNPAYADFTNSEVIEQLPGQDLEITISGSDDARRFLLGLRVDSSFKQEPIARYYAPLYYCTDRETGEEYTYVDTNYGIITPVIFSDEYAGKLLEENGQ